MHGMLRALAALLITPVALAQPPEFSWLNQFAGFPESALRNVAPAPGGFVGGTGTRRVPMKFRAPDGSIECHVLIRYENGRWTTTGDVGTLPSDDQNCGTIGGTFPVKAITPFGSTICIGGEFTGLTPDSLDYFACHTADENWFQINGPGNGPNGPVEALAFDGLNVYVGGSFTSVNNAMAMPTSARRIVRTGGFDWEPLFTDNAGTDNGVNGTVNAIFPNGGFIYAGVGSGVSRWNPSVNNKWTDLGGSNTSPVRDIEVNAGLIAASSSGATMWGGQSAGAVSEYDGGSMDWSAVGSSSGIDTDFSKLAIAQGFFHATGNFTSIDPDARGVARLNASLEWEAVPDSDALGSFPQFLDLFQMGPELCGVQQTGAGDQLFFSRGIACNDGQRWRGLSQGINGNVLDIVSYNGAVVAGGAFSAAGDEILDFIAEYRTGEWQPLGDGLAFTNATSGSPGDVRAMAVFQGDLYVVGLFNQADGQPTPGLARWDGQTWSAVGEGINFPGSDMVVWNDQLIITGTTPSGLGPILSWDGTSLTEVPDLPVATQTPTALAVYQGELIAAYRPGSLGAVLRLNGTTWETFTDNTITIAGDIEALLTRDNLLYVGGAFTARGAFETGRVVLWDGSSWSALGDGLEGGFFGVEDLVFAEDAVVATGWFDNSGGTPTERLAYFDGQQWYPIGPGLFEDISGSFGQTLMIDGSTVYVGGAFDQAGTVWSENIGAFTLRLETIFTSGFEG